MHFKTSLLRRLFNMGLWLVLCFLLPLTVSVAAKTAQPPNTQPTPLNISQPAPPAEPLLHGQQWFTSSVRPMDWLKDVTGLSEPELQINATARDTLPASTTTNSAPVSQTACQPPQLNPAEAESPSLGAQNGAKLRGFLSNTTIGLTKALVPDLAGDDLITILLLGSDSRADEKLEYGHTDAILIIAIDPTAETASVLSIPRDMWVEIPGYGENRINQAYRTGVLKKHPGGGPALMQETITHNFDIPLDYYALINFSVFEEVVDILGGLEICVTEYLNDARARGHTPTVYNAEAFYSLVPRLPLTGTTALSETAELPPRRFLYVEPGLHQFDGQTARKYAQSRATITGDFGRVQRQQAVLLALKEQAMQANIIPKLPQLWVTLSESYKTNFKLTDILYLAQLGLNMERSNITITALGQDHTKDYVTPQGASVLLAEPEAIKASIYQLFDLHVELEALTQLAKQANLNHQELGQSQP